MPTTNHFRPSHVRPSLLALALSQAISVQSNAATITVNSILDDSSGDVAGVCTLREAILTFNNAPPFPGDFVDTYGCNPDQSMHLLGHENTVIFDPVVFAGIQTITLDSEALPLNGDSDLEIQGTGQDSLIIDAGRQNHRVADITPGAGNPTIEIDDLSLVNGLEDDAAVAKPPGDRHIPGDC